MESRQKRFLTKGRAKVVSINGSFTHGKLNPVKETQPGNFTIEFEELNGKALNLAINDHVDFFILVTDDFIKAIAVRPITKTNLLNGTVKKDAGGKLYVEDPAETAVPAYIDQEYLADMLIAEKSSVEFCIVGAAANKKAVCVKPI